MDKKRRFDLKWARNRKELPPPKIQERFSIRKDDWENYERVYGEEASKVDF